MPMTVTQEGPMEGVAVIAALIAAGYGFAVAGIVGAFTGLVAAVGVGSGLAIAGAESGTGLAKGGAVRGVQRFGGIVAAIGCLGASYYGGWRLGWLWGIGGYATGVAGAVLVGSILRMLSQRPTTKLESATRSPEIPSEFDLNNLDHVRTIEEIREEFAAILMDDSHAYAGCMYRPSSLLPYPKPVVRAALITLLDFIERRRDSRHLKIAMRRPDVADAITRALEHLDEY
jgi:hypothetical protein